jgi:hypothetical protein
MELKLVCKETLVSEGNFLGNIFLLLLFIYIELKH